MNITRLPYNELYHLLSQKTAKASGQGQSDIPLVLCRLRPFNLLPIPQVLSQFAALHCDTLYPIYCKAPKFSDARKLCFNLPKFQEKRPNLWVFHQKDANGMANSEDPDQTAHLGAV